MDKVKAWIEKECQLFWQMLNHKARLNVPKGIMEFLNSGSDSEIENGMKKFSIIEKYLKILNQKNKIDEIADKYRRDFSNVKSEKQLSEIFSEIAVCATISIISTEFCLKPVTRKSKHSDFKSIIESYEVYGEIKRFEDKKKFIARSILTKADNIAKQKTSIPRFVELFGKLEDVYKQLPLDSINIIFLFHFSFGETVKYVKQVLFGEANFFNKKENLALEPISLFSKNEWKNISAVCLCRLGENGLVEFYEIFINPNANKQLPDVIADKIKNVPNIFNK
jgi:hypothetical protein